MPNLWPTNIWRVDLSAVTRKLRAVTQLERSGGPHMTFSSADQDRRHDTVVFDHR
jgi:hypothetical protein